MLLALALLYQRFAEPPAPEPAAAPAAAPVSAPVAVKGTRARDPQPVRARNKAGDFDFYLLALTVQAAFCEETRRPLRQCTTLTRASAQQRPLVLHGLWPERDRIGDYPQFCGGPRLDLPPALQGQVAKWMPGVEVGLDEHEWRKHGTCTSMNAVEYYEQSLRWMQRSHEALAAAVASHAGRRVSAATLRAEVDARAPGFARSVVYMCKNLRSADPVRRNRPYLYEVRVCIDDDGPGGRPQSLLACAAVGLRDQGCGASFWIDDV